MGRLWKLHLKKYFCITFQTYGTQDLKAMEHFEFLELNRSSGPKQNHLNLIVYVVWLLAPI